MNKAQLRLIKEASRAGSDKRWLARMDEWLDLRQRTITICPTFYSGGFCDVSIIPKIITTIGYRPH